MIEKGSFYRPIEGSVTGLVIELSGNNVHWMVKSTTFIIPIERFSEYFCKAGAINDDDVGADREGSTGNSV